MKMVRRNLGGFTNVVWQFTGARNIQILQLPTNFVEGTKNSFTEQTAFISQWAMQLKKGEALNLDKFCLYCKSQRDTFNISDVITINTFKAYARYTLKSCAIGQGIFKKNEDGEQCFFLVYRQKWDGHILGTWIPYNEESKKLLAVKTISAEDAEKKAEAKRKAMFEKLSKEFAN